ncbi:STAS/SEC14 domain-containing protein [candidate division WOR-3 bacterium]|nr:STAS/SEC14 domain-containing protein [candidate division WOR-3 bacterium]
MVERREVNTDAYKTWFDEEQGVLYVKTFKTIDAEDIHRLMPEVEKALEGKTNRLIIGDLSQNPSDLLTKEARQAFKRYTDKVNFDRIAVIGVNPITRMIVKIAVTIIGQSKKTQFFKTETQALAWLKEGEKK